MDFECYARFKQRSGLQSAARLSLRVTHDHLGLDPMLAVVIFRERILGAEGEGRWAVICHRYISTGCFLERKRIGNIEKFMPVSWLEVIPVLGNHTLPSEAWNKTLGKS